MSINRFRERSISHYFQSCKLQLRQLLLAIFVFICQLWFHLLVRLNFACYQFLFRFGTTGRTYFHSLHLGLFLQNISRGAKTPISHSVLFMYSPAPLLSLFRFVFTCQLWFHLLKVSFCLLYQLSLASQLFTTCQLAFICKIFLYLLEVVSFATFSLAILALTC